ncbi:hypothetical protein HMPREF9098_0934 [Kingella denitrificans ATCC 33394]|uniref:Uncharacterized protein n=1 Tax=Kingella denitrificans ATCC 33394 TaxID=888741 RepID=F0EYK0_9NEIS|nr:hypothetical protein HMPREF9098_0934 [Kingella denitrificans ATCC 33394]
MVERNPGPENKEPWAGKRNPNHPNYDPNYVPYHMRDTNGKKGNNLCLLELECNAAIKLINVLGNIIFY